MKSNYEKLTKAELIKEIKKLKSEVKKNRNQNSLNDFESLKHQIKEKDKLIEKLKKRNKLESSGDKYADLFDHAPTGYATLNSKGIIEEINITGASILLSDAKKIKGIPFTQFIIEEDCKRFMQYLNQCKNSSGHCVEKFKLKNKNGNHLVVELTTLPYIDDKTKKLTYRISISDVSEQEKIEKSLYESEERFRLMADASPNYIWMTDKNNQLEYMNRTKLDFLGRDFDDLKQNQEWYNTRHPDDIEKFIKEFNEASGKYDIFTIEIRVKRKDGVYRWLLESAAPRFLKDGTFIGYIGFSMDITETKEYRIKIEKSLKEKEVLLKEIHHRVKNNLQIISSLLNLQRGYIKDDKMLNIFRSSQSRISAMALLHEKLYGSKNLSNIDFKDYVRSITRSLLNTYKNNVQHIRINLDIEEFQLDLDISINFGLIINELASNSLKYAFKDRSEGIINIVLKKDSHDNLLLNISDNGVGLPANFKTRVKKSLGLELVNNIVEQLQGKMEISEDGKTEFKITVPQYNLHLKTL